MLEAAIANHHVHNIGGYVEGLEKLLTEENLRVLEGSHDGVFAFFAFHPKADAAVAQYLTAGSLAADAGNHVFALFTMDGPVQMPKHVTLSSLGGSLTIEDGNVPAYKAVRQLFPADVPPALPGVVVLERFTGETDPLFVSLQTDADGVPQRARRILQLASEGWVANKKSGGDFATNLATLLARDGIPYQRVGRRSMREWLAAAYRIANQNASTIVSVVKLFS